MLDICCAPACRKHESKGSFRKPMQRYVKLSAFSKFFRKKKLKNAFFKIPQRCFHTFTLSRISVAWKNPHYNNIIFMLYNIYIIFIMAKTGTHIFVWKCENVKVLFHKFTRFYSKNLYISDFFRTFARFFAQYNKIIVLW